MPELLEARTYTSKSFDEGNGFYRCRSSVGRLHYFNQSSGLFENINHNFVPSNKTGYAWMNAANEWKIHFKANLDSANPILYETDSGLQVSFRPRGVALYDHNLEAYTIFANPQTTTANVNQTGHRITFPGLYGSASLCGFQLTDVGIKELFAINSLSGIPDPLSFGYDPATTFIVVIYQINHNADSVQDSQGNIGPGRDLGTLRFIKGGLNLGWMKGDVGFEENSPNINFDVLKRRVKRVVNEDFLLLGVAYQRAMTVSTFPYIFDPSLSIDVGASTDDCYTYLQSHSKNFTSLELTAGFMRCDYSDSKGIDYYEPSVRFLNVTIPQGSTIDTATKTVWASQTSSGLGPVVEIFGIKEANTATFSTSDKPHLRTRTTAKTTWTMPGFTLNNSYTTPSIVGPVSEIVGQGSWSSGNAMAFHYNVVQGTSNLKFIRTYDSGNSAQYPQLDIVYTAVGNPWHYYTQLRNV